MQTQLPNRTYVELPPPPDGLFAARREAARRRARRTVAAVSAGVSAVVVGAVVVLVGGGGGVAVLRPSPVTPATRAPAPAPAPERPSAAPSAVVGGGPARGRSAQQSQLQSRGGGHRVAPEVVSAAPSPSRHARDAAGPVLVRTVGAYNGSPRVCRTGASSTDTSVHPGDNWCYDVAAVAVQGGERLSVQLCRDSTSGGSLTFDSSREVDFAVVRAGNTVWRWSHDHAGTPSQHSLSAAADGCWTWSLVWPGVTQSGSAAGHGHYTLQAVSTSNELRDDRFTSVDFTY